MWALRDGVTKILDKWDDGKNNYRGRAILAELRKVLVRASLTAEEIASPPAGSERDSLYRGPAAERPQLSVEQRQLAINALRHYKGACSQSGTAFADNIDSTIDALLTGEAEKVPVRRAMPGEGTYNYAPPQMIAGPAAPPVIQAERTTWDAKTFDDWFSEYSRIPKEHWSLRDAWDAGGDAIRREAEHAARLDELEWLKVDWPPVPRTGEVVDWMMWANGIDEITRRRIAVVERALAESPVSGDEKKD